MPKVILTNDGIKETVIRPVVLDIAKQVQEWTGLKEMAVLFNGDTEVAVQPGSTIDDEPSFNNTASRPLWRIQARDEHRTEKLLATAVHQMEHPEYFYDEAIGVFLRPVYSPTLLTLDFEYRASDITAARRWRDEVRSKVSLSRDSRTHIVNYSYLVPEAYFQLLEHIHELREHQAGYGQDYITWLKNCFTQNTTILTTLAGSHERWAVREQQCRILGKFEFSELPDDFNKSGEDSAYVQTFSYQVYFDCPIATAADYPLMVHNQLIDERFWCIPEKDDIKKAAWRSPRSLTALGAFEVSHLARPAIEPGLKFPEFHEFFPRVKHRATVQVFSALIGILPPDPSDPDANKLLLNFNEVDDEYELRPEFLRHLKWDHKYLCTYGESMVNVSVYVGDYLLDSQHYEVDKDLNLKLNIAPDLRQTYYVRLSLITDPTVLSEAARQRQRENAEGITLIGAALCPNLVKYKMLPPVLGDNYISRVENEKFLKRIYQCTSSSLQGISVDQEGPMWATVMILFLESARPKAQ